MTYSIPDILLHFIILVQYYVKEKYLKNKEKIKYDLFVFLFLYI